MEADIGDVAIYLKGSPSAAFSRVSGSFRMRKVSLLQFEWHKE